jgi:hypothetical protein
MKGLPVFDRKLYNRKTSLNIRKACGLSGFYQGQMEKQISNAFERGTGKKLRSLCVIEHFLIQKAYLFKKIYLMLAHQ